MRVSIVYPGDRHVRANATPENNRFADLFAALAAAGASPEPAVYHDDFHEEVRSQLMGCDAVLVWVNPIEGGRDRSMLDAMLRAVAATGVFVSTHPDIIQQLGTKEMLYRTRELSWSCDTHLYLNAEQMRRELPQRLATGKARVLKQNRGQSGDGVWRVQVAAAQAATGDIGGAVPGGQTVVCARHAKRGAVEEQMTLDEFFRRCEPYFHAVDGRIIDQEFQERLPEGMTRCYLVHDRVVGFGHQAVNALVPASDDAPHAEAPQPGPRYYHPPTMPASQALKAKLEGEWIPALRQLVGIKRTSLPVLWDCDFLLGPRDAEGADTHVLCEVNVSSVAPYPPSAVPFIVDATLAAARAARAAGGR